MTEATPTTAKPAWRANIEHALAAIAAGVIILLVTAFVFSAVEGPKTQVELETEKCVREKGYGNWRGSLGVSLEQFCDLAVRMHFDAKQRLEDRRNYPELY